jgi:hypothetical protein
VVEPALTRCGAPYGALAASACTSTSSGRVPSIVATTAEPEAPPVRSPRKSSEGFATGSQPLGGHRKTPISSTPPKRFLVARSTRWSSPPAASK